MFRESAKNVCVLIAGALVALSAACGGGNDGGDGASIECGAGTDLQDGQCVIQSDGCGPNTTLEEGQCEPATAVCGEGTTLDQMTGECVPNSQISCGPGTTQMDGQCVPESEVMCGEGTVKMNGECVPETSPEDACQEGLTWDAEQQRCKLDETSCGDGTQLDAETGQCVAGGPQCGDGQVLDGGECVDKSSLCSGGSQFDEDLGACVASQILTGACSDPMQLTESQLSADTTLPMGNCYEVTEQIKIQDDVNLSVEPGVKIVFRENTKLRIRRGATLTAVGTSDNPIVFTGLEKTKGYWYGVRVNTAHPDNKLHHVQIRYGGQDSTENLRIKDSSSLSLKNTSITHSGGLGVYVAQGGSETAFSAFEKNTLTENQRAPLRLPAPTVDALDTDSSYTGNGTDVIFVTGSKVESDTTWRALGLPYRVVGGFDVEGGDQNDGALRLKPGVTVEMTKGQRLRARRGGILESAGTSAKPVTLTGSKEQKGHWDKLQINTNSPANELTHTVVEYAGSGGGAGVFVQRNGQLGIANSTIRNNAGIGVRIAIDFRGNAALRSFAKNTLTQNGGAPIKLPATAADLLDTDSSYSGNDVDRVIVDSSIQKEVQWANLDVPYRVVDELQIGSTDGRLDIVAGTTVKFDQAAGIRVKGGAALQAKGTSNNRVTLTGEQQVKGFWKGIFYNATDNIFNKLNYTTISYGGNSPWKNAGQGANLTIQPTRTGDASVAVDNLALENSLAAGVYMNGEKATPEVRSCSNVTYSGNDTDVAGSAPEHRQVWIDACGSP